MTRFVTILAILLPLGVIVWTADLFGRFGILLFTEQFVALMTAIALPLIFLTIPARRAVGGTDDAEPAGRRRTGKVPWYDAAAAVLGAGVCVYVAFRFPDLSLKVSRQPVDGLVAAAILIPLFVEGLRRTSGTTITLVVVFFFCLAQVGHLLPTDISGRKVGFERYVYFLVWDSSAIFGAAMQIVTTMVTAFVLFGTVLFRTGGSAFFTDVSQALMGRYRGGPAKIAILGSSLFGTISGSVVANVVTTGVVTIPMMKQSGFRAPVAAAVEAVASTGGQLLPPVMGISAFLMAEFLQIRYAEVALAALIPALLLYLTLLIQADLEAARAGLRGVDPALLPRAREVLKSGWFFPIPFVILIVALFWLNYQPESAALLATAATLAAAMAFGFKARRTGLSDLLPILRDTGMAVLDLFMIGAAAGLVIATLNYTGLGFGLTLALVHLSGGNLFALLCIAAVACIILGMGLPTVGVYILLATLIAPALVELGIKEIAAHLFILYYGCLSMITPPVAIGAFAAANLARANPMETALEAMRFGWMAFVLPFLFVFSDSLLMHGPVWLILFDTATAAFGIWLTAGGVIGYLFYRLGPAMRLICVAAGIALVVPSGGIDGGRWFTIGALAAGLALIGVLHARRRKRRRIGIETA